ncbi:NmrA family NAD(P)-binding protein [Caballeronia sp. BCC1704]|uniref:NmrA family NAD(P)-binding protein n=1 Tax=Caballeronia sp. BCC1704 TaxID=2676300 RepID=UPI0015898FC3|nr:NmrA family NAD(P)-binding protein [Caballeronia sp. BCC1704]
MYAITGISGQVGGALADALLQAGQSVRAVVRDAKKGEPWAARGCEVANARMNDANALAQAFEGAHGVFILLPPQFDPSPGFPETCEVIEAVVSAVRRAKPRKIVCLSTIGAQAKETNLLTQHTLLQDALIAQPIPVTFLRPGWFMENSAWDVQSAREEGVVHSFLQPLDRAIPMVATDDVGRTAARLLMDDSHGTRIIELEGPQRVSPRDIAAAFSAVLGKPVTAQAVPRESWRDMFEQQGMKNPMPRIRMLDGFNEGWIDFEGPSEDIVKGEVDIESIVRKLCA